MISEIKWMRAGSGTQDSGPSHNSRVKSPMEGSVSATRFIPLPLLKQNRNCAKKTLFLPKSFPAMWVYCCYRHAHIENK